MHASSWKDHWVQLQLFSIIAFHYYNREKAKVREECLKYVLTDAWTLINKIIISTRSTLLGVCNTHSIAVLFPDLISQPHAVGPEYH